MLLVDDDPTVLAATAASLEEKGFLVVTARSCEAALEVLASAGADVLVTDLSMPERDGADLARSARTLIEDLPILVLTGFARPELTLPGGAEILEKPFRLDDLATCISKLIAAAPSSPPTVGRGR
ncbi:response regulator [Caulobacter hibisci]|uniref:Response regulator n=1 Tax=Caulobacter hibisci TaxID=2035993 RepID=A0ABS0SXA9_9CAUL|nr:response regulator [Caulobacter hibisci]